MTTTLARMRQLIGTAADWAANDLVVGDGELALARNGNTQIKVGDGLKKFSELDNILDAVSFTYTPAVPPGADPRPLTEKLDEWVSLRDFGAVCDGVADDTDAVQAAFDSPVPVFFPGPCSVNSVTIYTNHKAINFNGYSLIGRQAVGGQYVLGIAARHLMLWDVQVSANYLPYAGAIRWFSASAGAPAQYCNVFGLFVSACRAGVIYGQEIGTGSLEAPQSENTIYGFRCRSVQTPWVGNQTQGFMTLVSPILDCNPYEWATQPGYDATAWQTAAMCLNNIDGVLNIVGGEILKTSSQLGVGMRGGAVTISGGCALEIACTQAEVLGPFSIRDNVNGYMAGDSVPAFKIGAGAVGALRLLNGTFHRGPTVGSYSGERFISYASPTNDFDVWIEGGVISEWKLAYIAGRSVHFRDVTIYEASTGPKLYANEEGDRLPIAAKDGGIYSLTGWFFLNAYGGGSGHAIAADGPVGRVASSLQVTSTGECYSSTTDETSPATIAATSMRVTPGELYVVSGWSNLVSGGGAGSIKARFFNKAGVYVSEQVLWTVTDVGWTKHRAFAGVPADCAYMGIRLFAQVNVSNLTGIEVARTLKLA